MSPLFLILLAAIAIAAGLALWAKRRTPERRVAQVLERVAETLPEKQPAARQRALEGLDAWLRRARAKVDRLRKIAADLAALPEGVTGGPVRSHRRLLWGLILLVAELLLQIALAVGQYPGPVWARVLGGIGSAAIAVAAGEWLSDRLHDHWLADRPRQAYRVSDLVAGALGGVVLLILIAVSLSKALTEAAAFKFEGVMAVAAFVLAGAAGIASGLYLAAYRRSTHSERNAERLRRAERMIEILERGRDDLEGGAAVAQTPTPAPPPTGVPSTQMPRVIGMALFLGLLLGGPAAAEPANQDGPQVRIFWSTGLGPALLPPIPAQVAAADSACAIAKDGTWSVDSTGMRTAIDTVTIVLPVLIERFRCRSLYLLAFSSDSVWQAIRVYELPRLDLPTECDRAQPPPPANTFAQFLRLQRNVDGGARAESSRHCRTEHDSTLKAFQKALGATVDSVRTTLRSLVPLTARNRSAVANNVLYLAARPFLLTLVLTDLRETVRGEVPTVPLGRVNLWLVVVPSHGPNGLEYPVESITEWQAKMAGVQVIPFVRLREVKPAS